MIFLGIPSPVAVASVANQLVAPSVSECTFLLEKQ